ncbi:MAG: GGDEF domain-containing protein [Thiobacillus sp.]|nr:GGDEF domain-containing protein [Thiobacillus sp.]
MLKSHRYVIGKIYFVAGLSLFLLVGSFYLFGFKPLSDRLQSEHAHEIDYSLASSLWRIQGVLDRHGDLAKQTSSRTAIRDKLVAYSQGHASLDELVKFSAPKLADAMEANADIVGIARFDADARPLFAVGEQFALRTTGQCTGSSPDDVQMLGVGRANGNRRLLYCAPITAPGIGLIGTDVLTVSDDAIQQIINAPPSGVVKKEMTIGLVADGRILYWPGALTESRERRVLEHYLRTGEVEQGYLTRRVDVGSGGWKLYTVVNQDRFFGDINDQLFLLLSVISGVAAFLFAMTVLALRPIIRSLLKEQDLLERSIHDGLTGLYNHAYMEETLEREIVRTRRYRRPLSILMFDIDHFKKVNDTYGHLCGDEVLREVSQRAQHSARAQDMTARYGGEEFMLILPETGSDAAQVLAERLRAEVAASKFKTSSGEIGITISLGVVTYTGTSDTITKLEMMRAVDSALYASKAGGRNRVSVARLDAPHDAD